jgi:A/G-specific adenine glycosylase
VTRSSGPEPTARWLASRLRHWFRTNGRSFPWRRERDPFRVLIAELLLQRTRSDLVEASFRRLFDRYPTPGALARADPNDVEVLLRPLGFSHRSRRMPELARAIVESHDGVVPSKQEELRALPGVGRYIANAVLVIAFRRRLPLVDPNVIRVVGRVFGATSHRKRPRDDPSLWSFVESLLPTQDPDTFGLALVDLGTLICTPRRPQCFACPLRQRCSAFRTGGVTPHDVSESRKTQ